MTFYLQSNDFLTNMGVYALHPRYIISATGTTNLEAEAPAYRELARYAEKWQRDGLIWADVLIDQLDHNQLINQGRLITKWGTHEFTNDSRAWVEPSARWGSSSLYNDKKFPLRTPLSNIVAIPRTSKWLCTASKGEPTR
jgi:hypothetical protein